MSIEKAQYVTPHPLPAELERELLGILQEECGEVVVHVSKALRFGLEDGYPGSIVTNRECVAEEVGHVIALAQMLVAEGVLSQQAIDAAAAAKPSKVRRFLQSVARSEISRSAGGGEAPPDVYFNEEGDSYSAIHLAELLKFRDDFIVAKGLWGEFVDGLPRKWSPPTAPAQSAPASGGARACTCYPSEAPVPCQHKYALSSCLAEALRTHEQTIADLTRERDELHLGMKAWQDKWDHTKTAREKAEGELVALREKMKAAKRELSGWLLAETSDPMVSTIIRAHNLLTDPAPPTSARVDEITEAKAGGNSHD